MCNLPYPRLESQVVAYHCIYALNVAICVLHSSLWNEVFEYKYCNTFYYALNGYDTAHVLSWVYTANTYQAQQM